MDFNIAGKTVMEISIDNAYGVEHVGGYGLYLHTKYQINPGTNKDREDVYIRNLHMALRFNHKLCRETFRTVQSVAGRSNIRRRYRDRVKLFKPHGSLDWYQTPQGPVRYQGNFSENRLIITPGTNKYRQGYNAPFDLHRDEGNKCIDNASRLLIIGYGFNDDHLETHLEKQIQSGTPTVILSRSLSPKAQELSKLANVVGIEQVADGSRIISGEHSKEITLSNIIMWDLNGFISEVLEI